MKINEHFRKIAKENDLFKDIIGQDKAKKEILSALMMDRHIILVGAPGIGKTTMAKNVAKLLPNKDSENFIRVQGSPDLTVEDLLGDIDPIKALKFGATSVEAFTPGKVFKANNGVLFFDEVNRAPERLQNALLQILEEGKATLSGYDVDFDTNFIFIGTMNPEDFTGTEKLSEVFLDRFDLIEVTYPETLEMELDIVKLKGKKLDGIEFEEKLLKKVIGFVRNLRVNENVERAPSVRASLGLYERAQSNALLNNRSKVSINDIMEAINSVITHRIKLKPSVKYLIKPEDFIKKQMKEFFGQESVKGDSL